MDVENDEDGLNIEGANINKVKLGFFFCLKIEFYGLRANQIYSRL